MRLKIRYRAYNSGGPGGQHQNRSENAIEASVTLPDGREVKARSEMKSQHASKRAARAILASRVREALTPPKERGRVAGFGKEGRVRTYHEPNDRVSDESGFAASFRQTVGRGRMEELIEERRKRLV